MLHYIKKQSMFAPLNANSHYKLCIPYPIFPYSLQILLFDTELGYLWKLKLYK